MNNNPFFNNFFGAQHQFQNNRQNQNQNQNQNANFENFNKTFENFDRHFQGMNDTTQPPQTNNPNPKPNTSNNSINNNKLYKILDIHKTANDKEIKKAFLKKSLKGEYRHPDKGGSEEKFKELKEAYDILKDNEKRKLYDEYGEDSLGEEFNPNVQNAFEEMFGFRTQNVTPKKQPLKKGQPTTFQLGVTLEELCKNTTKKIKIKRRVVFNTTANTKVDDNKLELTCENCSVCDGRGSQIRVQQIQPGFIQKSQTPCSKCNTTGRVFKSDYELRNVQEILEIFIEKGSTNGNRIKFENKGNAGAGLIPSDLIIIIEEKKHDIYMRKENDLLIKKQITIDEAINQSNFYLLHPDGRTLNINTASIISPSNNIQCIEGAGMPIKGDSYTYGKLYIAYDIVFPNEAELSVHSHLKTKIQENCMMLPGYKQRIHRNDFIPTEQQKNEEEPHITKSIDTNQFKQEFGIKTKTYKSAHDSDSDDDIPHQQQCRQM